MQSLSIWFFHCWMSSLFWKCLWVFFFFQRINMQYKFMGLFQFFFCLLLGFEEWPNFLYLYFYHQHKPWLSPPAETWSLWLWIPMEICLDRIPTYSNYIYQIILPINKTNTLKKNHANSHIDLSKSEKKKKKHVLKKIMVIEHIYVSKKW